MTCWEAAMKNFIPLFLMLLLFTMSMPTEAEPVRATQETLHEAHQLILDAGQAMDAAWDAFHQAALGGTLASPQIQTSAEQDLMQGRALLRKARKAQHEGNIDVVRSITEQIQKLSREIVVKSLKEKE